jgi:hypothetical protein
MTPSPANVPKRFWLRVIAHGLSRKAFSLQSIYLSISGFITPSDTRGRRCRPFEMLTYWHVCCAFESACALPSGVIRGCETTSSYFFPKIPAMKFLAVS